MSTLVARLLSIALICSLITFAGCNQSGAISKASADKVRSGMSESEVIAILGPATHSAEVAVPNVFGDIKLPDGVELPKNARQSVWEDHGKVITVTFADGKVVTSLFAETGTPSSSGSAGTKSGDGGSSGFSDQPFEQTGSFTVVKGEAGPINFPLPYALPPNVELVGSDAKSVIVSKVTPTGFEWKGVDEVHWGGGMTWRAKGVKATKLPDAK